MRQGPALAPRGPVRGQVRLAIFFIIFDIEPMFVFPWTALARKLGWFGLIAVLVYLGLLMLGFLYIWKQGGLEPMGLGSFFTSRLDEATGWARKYSIFQYPFVTACCGVHGHRLFPLRCGPLRGGAPTLLAAAGRCSLRRRDG